MNSSPVIEFRQVSSPNALVSTLVFSGSGSAGAIPLGTASTVVTLRLYNNFLAASGVSDATGVVFAVYDDSYHEGLALSVQTLENYVQIMVMDYNGVTTGADTQWYLLGGQIKHALPVNGGVLAGSSTNYVTFELRVMMPTGASLSQFTQTLWIEYNASA